MRANSTPHKIGHFVRQPGFILAAISFLLGLVWINVIQPLDAPDEPGHLQAIMQVRKQHVLPQVHFQLSKPGSVIANPPSDTETRAYVAGLLPKLPVQDQHFLVPYESFQPPLYYVAAGLIAQVVPPEPKAILYTGRVVAALLGAATVYFCWLATREFAPDASLWAIASAGVVALLPQFSFSGAHASNDAAVELTATAAFFVWIRGLRDSDFDQRLLVGGAMLGLALLSKLIAVALIPGLALIVLFRIFQVGPHVLGLRNWMKRSLYMILGAALGAMLVSGWWFVRNLFIYGEFTGTAAALRFFAARFTKADFIRPRTASDLARYTLESLWGRFGWNDITLPHDWYHLCNSAAAFLITLSVLAGVVVFMLWATRRRASDIVKWQATLVFLAVGLALLEGYIQFNQKIGYMPMARYFFITLLPGTLLLTGGLYTFAVRPALRLAALSLLLLGLAVLNASALVTVRAAGTAHGGVRQNAPSIRR